MPDRTLALPHDVEFDCPVCGRPVRFVIGIREGVPSDHPGGWDYFPRCPHCGAEARITVYPEHRPARILTGSAALVASALLLLGWLWSRTRGRPSGS